MMIAGMVAATVLIGLLIWAPWNHNRTADHASPSTTVGSGSSTNRPAAPASPSTTTSPAAPAAPSTTK
jgi:hypothetical protein